MNSPTPSPLWTPWISRGWTPAPWKLFSLVGEMQGLLCSSSFKNPEFGSKYKHFLLFILQLVNMGYFHTIALDYLWKELYNFRTELERTPRVEGCVGVKKKKDSEARQTGLSLSSVTYDYVTLSKFLNLSEFHYLLLWNKDDNNNTALIRLLWRLHENYIESLDHCKSSINLSCYDYLTCRHFL